jgi:hypothetical protein
MRFEEKVHSKDPKTNKGVKMRIVFFVPSRLRC